MSKGAIIDNRKAGGARERRLLMKKYCVIIVGGGPAGTMTALALTHLRPELASSILLLESKTFPREKICGGGVSGRVVSFLEDYGVSLEKLDKVSVSGFTICFDAQAYSVPFGNDKCFVVRRSRFDQLLLDEVKERGVEVRAPAMVTGAYRERRRIAVIDVAGNEYSTDIFVGADGVNGRSRYWFGKPPRSRKTLLLQTDFPRDPSSRVFDSRLILDYTPRLLGRNGYAWFFPSIDSTGQPVVNAGLTGGEFAPGSFKESRRIFLAMLDRHPEIKEMAGNSLTFRAYPERSFSPFRNTAGPRVLLVGEQLGVDAYTGEGLDICAASARAAASQIMSGLERGVYTFPGYIPRLFASDFFPLYLIGTPFWMESPGPYPSVLFSMATRKSRPEHENILEIYAKLFSGSLPGRKVFSPYFIKPVLRDLPPAIISRFLAEFH